MQSTVIPVEFAGANALLSPRHRSSMAFSFSCSCAISPTSKVSGITENRRSLQCVKKLCAKVRRASTSPAESLEKGNWVKLICGASFEDSADVRNLSLLYTLAGVDCIDCAADESVVAAVNEGIAAAGEIAPVTRPWVMISVNDDIDLHFRKAEFDPTDCPLDCSRPCEKVCPANAIALEETQTVAGGAFLASKSGVLKGGVITERCYGCGRCFPVCPYDRIREITYVREASTTANLLERNDVDALEIHTSGRQTHLFEELWNGLGNSVGCLRLVAVSLPDLGDQTTSSMKSIYSVMKPGLSCSNLWQLDGRPMSGDIGRGATKQSIAFAARLVSAKDRPPGFLQLAGGTNAHTVRGLKKEGLFQSCEGSNSLIGGVAFGGYARKIVGRVLSTTRATMSGLTYIEEYPDHFLEALKEAVALVAANGSISLFMGGEMHHAFNGQTLPYLR